MRAYAPRTREGVLSSLKAERMFVLAELQYIIRVEPRRFGKDMKREITDELNRKFANKVCSVNANTDFQACV